MGIEPFLKLINPSSSKNRTFLKNENTCVDFSDYKIYKGFLFKDSKKYNILWILYQVN